MSTPPKPGSDEQTKDSASSTPTGKTSTEAEGVQNKVAAQEPAPPTPAEKAGGTPTPEGAAHEPAAGKPVADRSAPAVPRPVSPPRPAAPPRGGAPIAAPKPDEPKAAKPDEPKAAKPPAAQSAPAAPKAPEVKAPAATPAPPKVPEAAKVPEEKPAPAAPKPPAAPNPPAAQATRPQTKPASDRGTPQPPWQRGVQREPQTNVTRPGQSQGQPAQSGRPAQPARPAPAAPTRPAQPVARAVTPAPPERQREAAAAKAQQIDGPTRHISRSALPKDMPDLSEAKHPTPAVAAATASKPVASTATAAPQRIAEGEPLRASVQLRHIDPWSMLKISSVISVSLFFVWMVAVGLLYAVLEGMGVWDRLNNAFTDFVTDSSAGAGLVTAGQVFGYATVIGLINMVLFTALATIGSFIYNLCADLVGGLEVTLADRD